MFLHSSLGGGTGHVPDVLTGGGGGVGGQGKWEGAMNTEKREERTVGVERGGGGGGFVGGGL